MYFKEVEEESIRDNFGKSLTYTRSFLSNLENSDRLRTTRRDDGLWIPAIYGSQYFATGNECAHGVRACMTLVRAVHHTRVLQVVKVERGALARVIG
jgi:hypothetical protein